jgi:glycosyltransferase involved in cell wall biosynthesis
VNVLLVSHHALPHVGGVEVLVDMEARELARQGHHVTHVTSDASGAGRSVPYPPNVRLVRVRAWHVVERRFHLAYPIFSIRLLRVLWRESRRADVVHVHGFIYLSSLAAMVVAALRGRPRMLTDHGAIQRYHTPLATLAARAAAETVGRLTCRLATVVMAYNQRVLDVMSDLNGRRSPARFVPYPVDRSVFHRASPDRRRELRRELGWPDTPRTVLFVGRLNPDKGADLLVQAGNPARYRIVICGPGDTRNLGDLRGRDDVTVLEPRPQSEVRKLYQAADVVAVPTVPGREGFPLVVREALACGTPVVLAYEPGYEPYRALPGLTFFERTVDGLRAALDAVLCESHEPDEWVVPDELAPTAPAWIRQMYDLGPCHATERA